MRSRTLQVVLAILAVTALVAAAGCSRGGENYPTKPITYLIVFDPGGQSDRAARLQQPYLEKALGQKIIIDYKVGGGGAVGWAEAARSKPDGYTIVGINLPTIIAQPLQQDSGYKTEQLLPVCDFEITPLALAVPSSSPYKTLKDFIDGTRAKGTKVRVGGVTMFSATHLFTLSLAKDANLPLEFVPFTGSAPMMTAFLGGHIDAMIGYSDDLTKYQQEARALAFATQERFPGLPDVPTCKEQGFNYEFGIERGVAVPAGTPDPIVKKLEKVFLDVVTMPENIEAAKKEGKVPIARNSQETKDLIAKQTVVYKAMIEELSKK